MRNVLFYLLSYLIYLEVTRLFEFQRNLLVLLLNVDVFVEPIGIFQICFGLG